MENLGIKFWFIVALILIGLGQLLRIIHLKLKARKKINFDEFEDISKIKERDQKEKEDILHETMVLDKVYTETYMNSDKYAGSTILAHLDALDAKEKAKQDLEDFKMLDQVEVEKEGVYEQVPISALREAGNTMEIELFKKWARGIFGCIKIGTEEQLSVVKDFMTEDLYSKFFMQAKAFENDGVTFVTEDIIINSCDIYDYGRSLDKEEIKVLIDANMKEYIIKNSDHKIIRGNNKKYNNKKVLMTFLKRESEEPEGLENNCPNCGTAVNQTELGKCRYCGTIILPIRYNWTLTKFETM